MMTALRRPFAGAPVWAWLLALVPWFWVIPMNQRFWDDWIFVAPKTLEWHLEYWLTVGAKHYFDPFVMPALYGLGMWSVHLVNLAAACVAAWSFSKVFERLLAIRRRTVGWFGPCFLVFPVYQARFSGVTLEYTVSLALVSVAWLLLISQRSVKSDLVAAGLLAIAVGVPSVAILFPFVFATTVYLRSRWKGRKSLVLEMLRGSFILIIPVLYSLIFSRLVNDGGKYQVSVGGVWAFVQGLFVLIILILIIAGVVNKGKLFEGLALLESLTALVLGYVGLFPYLAVGFNPVSAFLPWRMKAEVLADLPSRFVVAFSIFCVVAWVTLRLTFNIRDLGTRGFQLLLLLPAVLSGAVAFGFGPMDWESRHWLIAWPFLTLSLSLFLSCARRDWQQPLIISAFLVLLASSVLISMEYFVDSLKQRALVKAVQEELGPMSDSANRTGDPVIVLIQGDETSGRLDARYRTYRSHEWWGMVATGLGPNHTRVWILEPDDLVNAEEATCAKERVAYELQPRVLSTAWEAVSRMRVDLSLNPSLVSICPGAIRGGWPRDALP